VRVQLAFELARNQTETAPRNLLGSDRSTGALSSFEPGRVEEAGILVGSEARGSERTRSKARAVVAGVSARHLGTVQT
jgi:hypothetical protein